MKIFFLNDKSSKLVLPMKDEAVVMETEASNISMSNMSDVEMAQDFDKENKEEVKVSADIQEILFEAYVESVKKQILARSNEIRNLYRKVMDDFLFNNPN
ncbi:hypothetical protein PVAND_005298 [Polypedilum vanderplanki]|uniref:Uncharacterized protein n=1 Tax=Polypedilum vanderplanki TaxID=319348 RepID=A0A9J6C1N2_POLVA|nr:hypothetical protein PVAND_005298 [Polypedilum vanderplanki]